MSKPSTGARGVRETLLLTLGLSALIYLVFLGPMLLSDARFPVMAYVAALISVVPGLALFPALFVLVSATARWRAPGRAIMLGLVAVSFAWVHTKVDYALSEAFLDAFAPDVPRADSFVFEFSTLIWTYACSAALVGLILSRFASQERDRQLAEAREAVQAAQLAALRFQLNPHFLFNTLNAISSLIISRRNDDAERMTGKLSDFLRATLGADPHNVVTLEEELDTALSYLDIEKVRFGDRLAVEIDCPGELGSALVPSFLIQPMVENAVKYAVAPSRAPVTISISARRLGQTDIEITIADDGTALPHAAPTGGIGVGLANVRSRLAVLHGERGRLFAGQRERGFACVVTLPLERRARQAAAE